MKFNTQIFTKKKWILIVGLICLFILIGVIFYNYKKNATNLITSKNTGGGHKNDSDVCDRGDWQTQNCVKFKIDYNGSKEDRFIKFDLSEISPTKIYLNHFINNHGAPKKNNEAPFFNIYANLHKPEVWPLGRYQIDIKFRFRSKSEEASTFRGPFKMINSKIDLGNNLVVNIPLSNTSGGGIGGGGYLFGEMRLICITNKVPRKLCVKAPAGYPKRQAAMVTCPPALRKQPPN